VDVQLCFVCTSSTILDVGFGESQPDTHIECSWVMSKEAVGRGGGGGGYVSAGLACPLDSAILFSSFWMPRNCLYLTSSLQGIKHVGMLSIVFHLGKRGQSLQAE